MSRILNIPDELYARLESAARKRGVASVEQLLEAWEAEADAEQRNRAVERIDALRTQLYAKYGEMPDSTTLLREDRER